MGISPLPLDFPQVATRIGVTMPRPVILAGLLGAAVGVPYMVDRHSGSPPPEISAVNPTSVDGEGLPALNFTPPVIPQPEGPGALFYVSPAPLEGIPATSLAEVLRFDVTKEWVYGRWSRKSTGLAEPELFGVRVPLVSGTRMTDVAGSLTYYFSAQGGVEKIELNGKTADTTELVNLLVRQYGFQPQVPLVAGEQLYQVRHRDRVESELRTWPEPILWSTSPHNSFSVELELNRPGSRRTVSRPIPKLDIPPDVASTPAPPASDTATPVFPPEQIVSSAKEGASTEATAVSSSPASGSSAGLLPKKVEKPVLRWPN